MSGRGAGRTMAQMKAAPPKSIFVWCNDRLHYPMALARELDRHDLLIIAPRDLSARERLAGLHLPITIDHAAHLTLDQLDGLNYYRTGVRP